MAREGGSSEEENKGLARRADQKVQGELRFEGLQQRIDDAADPVEREQLRAAAARQITSPEATKANEYRLQPLSELLEPNPRSMKRLVNAYGLNQARAFLEGRKVDVEALARWTIVELRWPVLSEYFSENWTDLDCGFLDSRGYPDPISLLLADEDV